MATSFRIFTYLTRSNNGTKIANPGSNILLNLPILSTTHASCCGTNLIGKFVGSLLDVREFEEDEDPQPDEDRPDPEEDQDCRALFDVESEREYNA
jgi:hypothetical protein